jgi:predicted O-methyltransferase YrrM
MAQPAEERYFPPLDLNGVGSLYKKFASDLRRVRSEEEELYRRWSGKRSTQLSLGKGCRVPKFVRRRLSSTYYWLRSMRRTADLQPLFADFDSELTYLFLRAIQPDTVVEISPAGGWSTSWILSALRDNHRGALYSFDLMDDSTRTLPSSLRVGRWYFTQGDVKKKAAALPPRIDYLFLDSDHSHEFAEWYLKAVFPRLSSRALVSVDDVFRDWAEDSPSDFLEAQVVLRWLALSRTEYFTVSRHHARDVWNFISELRKELCLEGPIVPYTGNPAVFFYYRPADQASEF